MVCITKFWDTNPLYLKTVFLAYFEEVILYLLQLKTIPLKINTMEKETEKTMEKAAWKQPEIIILESMETSKPFNAEGENAFSGSTGS
jgi:hypothetical protein